MAVATRGNLQVRSGADLFDGVWRLDDTGSVVVEHPILGTKIGGLGGLAPAAQADGLFRELIQEALLRRKDHTNESVRSPAATFGGLGNA